VITAAESIAQYNGRVYDPGTGFHDYGARMYWPQIGRFISPDTYGGDPANPASLNRYSYVQNNPYKYADPTGHFAWLPWTMGAGAVIGGVTASVLSYQGGRRGEDLVTDILGGIGMGGLAGTGVGLLADAVAAPRVAQALQGAAQQVEARGPAAGGGAAVENVGAAEAARIQNAANRIGERVHVVGSRAAGTAGPNSDWDFVVEASAKVRNSVSSALPGAKNVAEGVPRNQDIFKGPLDPSKPHITFTPKPE
jgi:RHS repeat-associated protein